MTVRHHAEWAEGVLGRRSDRLRHAHRAPLAVRCLGVAEALPFLAREVAPATPLGRVAPGRPHVRQRAPQSAAQSSSAVSSNGDHGSPHRCVAKVCLSTVASRASSAPSSSPLRPEGSAGAQRTPDGVAALLRRATAPSAGPSPSSGAAGTAWAPALTCSCQKVVNGTSQRMYLRMRSIWLSDSPPPLLSAPVCTPPVTSTWPVGSVALEYLRRIGNWTVRMSVGRGTVGCQLGVGLPRSLI